MAKQSVDLQGTLEALEKQHATLKRQVATLERRPHMTPNEEHRATSLKKKKLMTKDAIAALRAQMN